MVSIAQSSPYPLEFWAAWHVTSLHTALASQSDSPGHYYACNKIVLGAYGKASF